MTTFRLGSPWTAYGLRDDPFFQQPLQPTSEEEAPRPITLFVGRDAELALVANQVIGSTNSRAILEGDAGVGKTSFVSRLKTELSSHNVLMHAEPVRLRPGMTARQFIAELLKVLLQISATLAASESPGTISKARQAAVRGAAIGNEAAFWRNIGRLIQGEDSTAAGLTIASFGAQRENVRIPAEVDEVSLFDELAKAVAYLTANGRRKVLLHLDNMENLSLEEEKAAAALIQQVRDCFLVDHTHWLFVGTTGIEQHVFRASAQVSGIVPFSIRLDPLRSDEVVDLLDRRYRHLRSGLRLVHPISPPDGAALYARYRGQLRAFLSLLSNAVQRHSAFAPGQTLSIGDVLGLMTPEFRVRKLLPRVSPEDAAHLAKTLAGTRHDAEFRVSELAEGMGATQAAASKLAKRLLSAGVIELSRTHGKSVYYRIAEGDLTVALGMQ